MKPTTVSFLGALFFSITTVFAQVEICGDGIDNDNDGQIDEVCQAFVCNNALFQSINTSGDYKIVRVNQSTGQFTTISNLTQQGLNGSFNSLGYNPVDNLLYGMGLADGKLYRIDASGDYEYVGTVATVQNRTSSGNNAAQAGTFDENGTYYISTRQSEYFSINVTTLVGTYLGKSSYGAADIAYNPVNKKLYGWDGGKNILFYIDPVNMTHTSTINITGISGWLGSLYFDNQGNLLAYNSSGQLIKLNTTTEKGSVIANGPPSSGSDGCSCSFGIELTKETLAQSNPGDTITYTFSLYNQSFNLPTKIAFSDTLPSGLKWTSAPYLLDNISFAQTPNTIGASTLNLIINTIPLGKSSFKIDAVIPCDFPTSTVSNQAKLTQLPSPFENTILSDDPASPQISDPTLTELSNKGLQLQLNKIDIVCEQKAGQITAAISGGTPPLRYNWSNNSTTSSIKQLQAGNYALTVTDSLGCQFTQSEQIDIIPRSLTPLYSVQDPNCSNSTDGNILALPPSLATPPVQYSLDAKTWGTKASFEALAAGAYQLYVRDSLGCTGQASIQLDSPKYTFSVSPLKDTTIYLGQSIRYRINRSTLSPVDFDWWPNTAVSCPDCYETVITPTETTPYKVVATDIKGCTDSFEFKISLRPQLRYFIPNAFSPNLDGKNDFFRIYASGAIEQVQRMQVFSRWGALLFEAQDFSPYYSTATWDGNFRQKPMPSGVYVYRFELLLKDGSTLSVNGDITLIR